MTISRYSFWTDEKVRQLLDANGEGLSATQIGIVIGCSRNSTISKLRRMQIPLKHALTWPSEQHGPRPNHYPTTRKPPRVKPMTPPEPKEPESLCISIMDSRDGQCKFIASDDVKTMTYCGHPTERGSSYCPYHKDTKR